MACFLSQNEMQELLCSAVVFSVPKGEFMGTTEIKITIDPNGNIRREVVDRPQPETRKPKFLKRLTSSLTTRTAALDNR
jgi:hypothetical protein